MRIVPLEDFQHKLRRREGEPAIEEGLEDHQLPRLWLRPNIVSLGEPVAAIGTKFLVLDQLIDMILADLRRER